jgi:hypothetical protein
LKSEPSDQVKEHRSAAKEWFEVTLDQTGTQRPREQWFKLREKLSFTAHPFQKGFGCDGADVG